MKTFDCLTTYITENLAINIDLSNIKSFDSTNLDDMISLTKWQGSKTSDLLLYDYGLTNYDSGLVNDMELCQTLSANNNKLQLKRAKYNDLSGNTSYLNLDVQPITGATSGTYIELNGGYFQNYFKLFQYDYELFPARYNLGITIETLLNISSGSTGIFYMMGTRAEDKYNDIYSGETQIGYVDSIPSFTGITTTDGNYLNAYQIVESNKAAFKDFADKIEYVPTKQEQIENLKDNIISFGLTLDKKLFYRYVNSNGNVTENYSENSIPYLGWNIVTITFEPDELIFDYQPENYLCYDRRKGSLIFYVNGKQFWKIKDFDEFYFKQITNTKEKMIGVPFNISWGGGSYGLKHSYHYDYSTHTIYNNNDQTYLDNNFIVYDSVDLLTINSGVTLTENNMLFVDDQLQPISVIEVANTGSTEYYVSYNSAQTILSNRIYTAKCSVNLNGGTIDTNKISIQPTSMNNFINIVDLKEFQGEVDLNNEWVEIYTNFIVDKSCQPKDFDLGVFVYDESGNTITNTTFYIKNIEYVCQDILVKDTSKDNLMVEKYFNESFIGGIQKLRIYDRALSSNEIYGNAFFESKNNRYLNLNIVKGGRIIRT